MDICREILHAELGKIICENLKTEEINYAEIVNLKAVVMIQKIKNIIDDDSLSDFDCVEKIVRVFEESGSGAVSRHDFG